MVRFFKIVFCLFFVISCKAQIPTYPLGTDTLDLMGEYYLKDYNNNLDKFVGTWVYTQGTTTFTLVIKKAIKVRIVDYYSDELQITFKYVQNGVVKSNTLSLSGDKSPVISMNFWPNNFSKMSLHYMDPERPKVIGKAVINTTFIALGAPSKLQWSLVQTGLLNSHEGDPEVLMDFRVPTSATLTKVN